MAIYNKPQIQILNSDNLVYRGTPYNLQFTITKPTLIENIIDDNNYTSTEPLDNSNLFEYSINKSEWQINQSNSQVEIYNMEITDKDILQITGKKILPYTYKVYFNDEIKKEVLKPIINQDITDNINILGAFFNDFVDGKIKIEVQYGYKEDILEVKEYDLKLINTAPVVIIGDVINNKLDFTVNDEENDNIQINIKLNGQNYFPSNGGFTELLTTPYFYTTTFDSEKININPKDLITPNNIVTITIKDKYGAETQLNKSFVGEFYGLMFTDKNGDFFSTDSNNYINDKNILKELYLGNIKAGTSGEKRIVYLQNRTNNILTNIKLTLVTAGIPDKTYVKISKNALIDFSDMKDTIDFQDLQLNINEKIPFYTQANTEILSLGGGYFYIDVIADAIV